MTEQVQFTTQTVEKTPKLVRSYSVNTADCKESQSISSSRVTCAVSFTNSSFLAHHKLNNPEQSFGEEQSLMDASVVYKNCGPCVTDRFIPCRKMISVESLYQNGGNAENEQSYLEVEPSHYQISDIYKKYVMNKPVSILQTEKKQIGMFRSSNIFKFNQSHHYTQQHKVASSWEHEQIYEELSKYKKKRNINKVPLKVLDAPSLQNDYYLNVIDWSKDNIIAVGLASNVYLWNGGNSRVTKLCDVGVVDSVCSVSWSNKQPQLAVGSSNGEVRIWDVEKLKKIRSFNNHTNRVSAIGWGSNTFCTGSRDKLIYQCDPRIEHSFYRKLQHHKQEVCGLKWSPDEQQFCSGGNDNKLLVWNNHSTNPIYKFNDHQAAVKAVAWSPHQHGLLASGGGTADRTIKFRNTLTGQTVKSMDVGSQVCNLTFSKSVNELVSTHGYSHNQINIWRYPKMKKIATLTGHTLRVLYLAISPDGSTIVTGAGDQTLRFWNVFPQTSQQEHVLPSQLKLEGLNIR